MLLFFLFFSYMILHCLSSWIAEVNWNILTGVMNSLDTFKGWFNVSLQDCWYRNINSSITSSYSYISISIQCGSSILLSELCFNKPKELICQWNESWQQCYLDLDRFYAVLSRSRSFLYSVISILIVFVQCYLDRFLCYHTTAMWGYTVTCGHRIPDPSELLQNYVSQVTFLRHWPTVSVSSESCWQSAVWLPTLGQIWPCPGMSLGQILLRFGCCLVRLAICQFGSVLVRDHFADSVQFFVWLLACTYCQSQNTYKKGIFFLKVELYLLFIFHPFHFMKAYISFIWYILCLFV